MNTYMEPTLGNREILIFLLRRELAQVAIESSNESEALANIGEAWMNQQARI
jgi:hypothetical protein